MSKQDSLSLWKQRIEEQKNTIKPIVKPNVTSWRGAMVSVFENNMMAMNDSENKYGFNLTDDTHMIKNIEWGAVAYLSHSKYGINDEQYNKWAGWE